MMTHSLRNIVRVTALLSLSACQLPEKICVGDCTTDAPDPDGGPATSDMPATDPTDSGTDTDAPDGTTTGEPDGTTTDATDGTLTITTDGSLPDVCHIEDDLAPAADCSDGVQESGEFCFQIGIGGVGFGNGLVSTVPGRFDAHNGVDFLVSHLDRTVSAQLDGPSPYVDWSTVSWPQTFPVDALILTDAADLNGDGFLDAVARRVGGGEDSVHPLYTDGAGMFVESEAFFLGQVRFGPEVHDWDADGNLDIVVVVAAEPNDLENVFVLFGDGAGKFTLTTQFGFNVPQVLAVGALGSDKAGNDFVSFDFGHIEVMLSSPGESLFVDIALEPGEVVHQLAIADLDDDGLGDIVALIEDTVGGGTAIASLIQSPADPDPAFTLTRYPVRCGATHFALGDIDQDGALDVVAGGPGGVLATATLRRGDGQGGFPQATSLFTGPVNEIHIADFTGDGWVDIAVTDFALGMLQVAPNTP